MPNTSTTINHLDHFIALSAALDQHNMTYKTSLKKKRMEEEEDMTVPVTPKKGFTFGCDPEGFIFDGDKPIPAAEAGIPGTKEAPYEIFDGLAVQVDGMAAEFNIPPVDNYEDWENYITTAVSMVESLLPDKLKLKFVPAVVFDEDTFNKADDYSKELGCRPDVNAWTGDVNPIPNPDDPYLRCSGGHLHVGWTENESVADLQHVLNCQDLGKQLDWFLGAWSTLEDQDKRRRQLYGKMGAIRYKPYGLEYRVLSSFWVTTKELRLQVWNRMNAAINAMPTMYLPERLPSSFRTMLERCINESIVDENLFYTCQYPIKTLQASQRQF